jgi:hypothetical protein
MSKKKAKSKTQRRLFGWAYACSKGEKDDCPENIKKLGDKFKEKYPEDIESMAKTKHKGLPEKVKKSKKTNEILSFIEFKKMINYVY